MKYSQELEVQQKAQGLGQEGMNLVLELLKQNILSLSIKPASFKYESALLSQTSTKKTLKFVGKSEGKKVTGSIDVYYKGVAKNVDKLVLYVEGSKKEITLSFDENLNIISCKASSLDNNFEMHYLHFDRAKEDLVRINYYDGDATYMVKDYLRKTDNIVMGLPFEKLYTVNGLMPDRETEIDFDSQEELLDIIVSFWGNVELTEKKFRKLQLIKDNK